MLTPGTLLLVFASLNTFLEHVALRLHVHQISLSQLTDNSSCKIDKQPLEVLANGPTHCCCGYATMDTLLEMCWEVRNVTMLLSGKDHVRAVVQDWQCPRCKRGMRYDGFDDGMFSSSRTYIWCRSRLDSLVSAITRFSMSGRAASGHRAEGARAAFYGQDEDARVRRLGNEAGSRQKTEAVALYMATWVMDLGVRVLQLRVIDAKAAVKGREG